MATINNVKHLTEEGVYEFLHNPNENYLEGFAVDKEPAFYCPSNCEDGTYLRLFKAPVNSRMTELLMQDFRWSAREGCYNTPLPEDCTISFKRAGFIADSSKFWILSDYLLKVCPKLKPELTDFRQQFERAFCKKILDDFSMSRDLINSKEAEGRAEQYAIYAMLKKKPVYHEYVIDDAMSIVRSFGFRSMANYILDANDYLESALANLKDRVIRSFVFQGVWYSRRACDFPKKVEAARLADKIAHTFIAADNDSQRIAKSVCAYCSRELNDRKNVTITIGTSDDNGIPVKVSCDTLLHYEPTSKEIFINVKSASKNEREKINQYVKDNGAFVSEDLVPMNLLQSVISYGWEHWNRDFPE